MGSYGTQDLGLSTVQHPLFSGAWQGQKPFRLPKYIACSAGALVCFLIANVRFRSSGAKTSTLGNF